MKNFSNKHSTIKIHHYSIFSQKPQIFIIIHHELFLQFASSPRGPQAMEILEWLIDLLIVIQISGHNFHEISWHWKPLDIFLQNFLPLENSRHNFQEIDFDKVVQYTRAHKSFIFRWDRCTKFPGLEYLFIGLVTSWLWTEIW